MREGLGVKERGLREEEGGCGVLVVTTGSMVTREEEENMSTSVR